MNPPAEPAPNTIKRFAMWLAAIAIIAGAGALALIDGDSSAPGDSEVNAPSVESVELPDVPPIFKDVTRDAGIDFVHSAGGFLDLFMPSTVTGGAAFLDYDRDGDLDIFFINATNDQRVKDGKEGVRYGPDEITDDLPTNKLYKQVEPMKFVDVTADSGLGDTGYGMGCSVADVNNDGHPDLFISCYGPDRLFVNNTDGTFTDITEQAGIESINWGTSTCFLDFDRDGWLDLFITNYVDFYRGKSCTDNLGRPDFCGPLWFPGTPDALYRNTTGDVPAEDGKPRKVTFKDVSIESGIAAKPGPGLAVTAADFNGDHWPDIYVANDMRPNFLWINNQDGTFNDEAILRGSAYDLRGSAQASMGIALGDVNGDSFTDMFVTNFAREANAMYMGVEAGGFEESAETTGLAVASMPYTAFGCVLLDWEHDGDLDVALVNGGVRLPSTLETSRRVAPLSVDSMIPDDKLAPFAEVNQLFTNGGKGKFAEFLSSNDPYVESAELSRGLAAGDVDNDGDIDLLVTNAGASPKLYENTSEKKGNWLICSAIEPKLGKRHAYGAELSVVCGERTFRQSVNPGVSYLISGDPRVHFGLGEISKIDLIDVVWPDGTKERFAGGDVNKSIVLEHGAGESQK